jgi:NADH:ubiquinone oxidoreductase subunit F (NADH-binding)
LAFEGDALKRGDYHSTKEMTRMGPDWIVVQEMKDSGLRGPSVVLVFRRG